MLFIGACAVGVSHCGVAGRVYFTARAEDPAPLIALMLATGPASTLFAVLVSLFRPRSAARWLIAAPVVSFATVLLIAATAREWHPRLLVHYIIRFVLPMWAVGAGLILLSGRGTASR